MTQSLEPSARLSGVDPFRAPEFPVGEEHVEKVWFDQPPSSRRVSVRPSAPPASTATPIGDRDADAWFR